MKFHCVCEVCRKDIFDQTAIRSYGFRGGLPYEVSLEGRDGPYAGIRCICVDCIRFLGNLGTRVPTSE
jgi:hypothetical protein